MDIFQDLGADYAATHYIRTLTGQIATTLPFGDDSRVWTYYSQSYGFTDEAAARLKDKLATNDHHAVWFPKSATDVPTCLSFVHLYRPNIVAAHFSRQNSRLRDADLTFLSMLGRRFFTDFQIITYVDQYVEVS